MLTVKGVVLEGPKNEKAINGYSELLGLSKHPKNLEPYHDDNYRDAMTDSSITEDTKKEIRYPVSSEYLAKFANVSLKSKMIFSYRFKLGEYGAKALIMYLELGLEDPWVPLNLGGVINARRLVAMAQLNEKFFSEIFVRHLKEEASKEEEEEKEYLADTGEEKKATIIPEADKAAYHSEKDSKNDEKKDDKENKEVKDEKKKEETKKESKKEDKDVKVESKGEYKEDSSKVINITPKAKEEVKDEKKKEETKKESKKEDKDVKVESKGEYKEDSSKVINITPKAKEEVKDEKKGDPIVIATRLKNDMEKISEYVDLKSFESVPKVKKDFNSKEKQAIIKRLSDMLEKAEVKNDKGECLLDDLIGRKLRCLPSLYKYHGNFVLRDIETKFFIWVRKDSVEEYSGENGYSNLMKSINEAHKANKNIKKQEKEQQRKQNDKKATA